MEENLKHKTVVSTVWASIQQFGKLGISFISNIVLARLLMPEDYGTVGMLAIFMAIAVVFVDSGLGNALIQRKNTSEVDYSTIFFFNLGMSVFLYFVLYFAAPFIARFYETEVLCKMLRIYGLMLIINSFSIIQNARLRKQLSFKALTTSTLIAATVSTLAGIFLAYKGFGVWSLVAMYLIEAVVRVSILWIQCKWLPQLVFSFNSLKTLFKFGGFLLANSLLFTVRRNILSLVLGKLYTARDLGMYIQAKKLEDIPITSISSIIEQVSFPVFSKLQDDMDRFKQMQRRSLRLLAFLCFPLMFLIMVISEPVIVFLYTDKWIEAVPYLQVLCFMGIFVCLQAVNANVVNAMGRSGLYFKWSVFKTIIMFSLIWIGHYWGIIGLLGSLVLYHFIVYVINAILASRYTQYTLWQQLKDLVPIALSSGLIAVAVWFVRYLIHNNFALITVQSLVFIVLYLFVYSLLDKSMLTEVLSLIGRKK